MEQTSIGQNKYKPGDLVVCIISSRASLTIGKEYEVLEVYGTDLTSFDGVWDQYRANEVTLVITSDKGEKIWYDHFRFVPKNEFRQHIINDILKK